MHSDVRPWLDTDHELGKVMVQDLVAAVPEKLAARVVHIDISPGHVDDSERVTRRSQRLEEGFIALLTSPFSVPVCAEDGVNDRQDNDDRDRVAQQREHYPQREVHSRRAGIRRGCDGARGSTEEQEDGEAEPYRTLSSRCAVRE